MQNLAGTEVIMHNRNKYSLIQIQQQITDLFYTSGKRNEQVKELTQHYTANGNDRFPFKHSYSAAFTFNS